MADNLSVTPGTGATMAADEATDGTLGSVKVPFAKIMDGTLDSTNKLVVNSSGEMLVNGTANTQPVSLASVPSHAVTNAGTFAVQSDNTKVGGTSIDTNSGLKSAGTQRVVLATDQPQLTNALKVDGSAVTQPVSGTVTANLGTGTADTNLKQVNGVTTQTGTGTAGTGTQRVAVASDSSIQLTDGTNTANVLKSDGTAAGQNAQMVAGTYLSVPFTTTTVQAVGTTDAGNYKSVSVHITSQGTSSVVNYQGSNDNTNWTTVGMATSGAVDSFSIRTSDSSSGVIRVANLPFRYFRLSVTGISAGTTAGTIIFSTLPITATVSAVQSNAPTGSAVPANAFYMGVQASTGNLSGLAAPNVLGDGNAIQQAASVAPYMYNGSTYDRQRGNTTDGLQVYTKGTASDNSITVTKVICAASTNATSVKASAGKMYYLTAFNSDTVGYWVKLYNKASAPTVGTDVPVVAMYAPPGGGFVIPQVLGAYFSTGIALATTLLATDADTTAVTNANKLVINMRYV